MVLFGVIAVQSANIQFFRAPALDASPENPRVSSASTLYPRGEIVAADGTILAQSVPSAGPYPYRRVYPLGSLTSDVVGFSSATYGNWWLEAQYNNYLSAHAQPAQSLAQLLAPSSAADNVTLTLYPALQKVARTALGGQDGSVVAINPKTGGVLAMYSNPTYNPAPLTSNDYTVASAAWKTDTTNNAHGFSPLGNVATQQTFPPGSTFKVVTTAAAVVGRPDLLVKTYKKLVTTKLPDTNLTLSNFGYEKCGGTVAIMLPVSCDTGYALMGLDLGGDLLSATADTFGYNLVPPLDLPGVVASNFPTAAELQNDLPGLAYSAIGQKNVRDSALFNAMIASALANNGTMMVPHLMSEITGPDGTVVKRFTNQVWQRPLIPAQAAQIVPLMVNVARFGTAAGIFPSSLDVAAKTGTAQVGNSAKNTDDWMIAFAPATNPVVAVAVVVPFQSVSAQGATVAGPIMKCVIEGAIALANGQPASGTSTTCPG